MPSNNSWRLRRRRRGGEAAWGPLLEGRQLTVPQLVVTAWNRSSRDPVPIGGFFEETFGGWYEGTWPPPAIVRACGGPSVSRTIAATVDSQVQSLRLTDMLEVGGSIPSPSTTKQLPTHFKL
jgi:hypothetical protein